MGSCLYRIIALFFLKDLATFVRCHPLHPETIASNDYYDHYCSKILIYHHYTHAQTYFNELDTYRLMTFTYFLNDIHNSG